MPGAEVRADAQATFTAVAHGTWSMPEDEEKAEGEDEQPAPPG